MYDINKDYVNHVVGNAVRYPRLDSSGGSPWLLRYVWRLWRHEEPSRALDGKISTARFPDQVSNTIVFSTMDGTDPNLTLTLTLSHR